MFPEGTEGVPISRIGSPQTDVTRYKISEKLRKVPSDSDHASDTEILVPSTCKLTIADK